MDSPVLLFVGFGILAIGLLIWGIIWERKRREAMTRLAQRLGLNYRPAKDRSLAAQYGFLNRLNAGSNRYAYNVLEGEYQGERIGAFDYHYETYSNNSKGGRQTHHHYLSCFVLLMPAGFPELTVSKEGFLSKIAQAVGYDDIDFESHEFSRSFCVRSKDKKFAYDFCNARMIEYLLENRDLSIEVESHVLAIIFGGRLAVDRIEMNLARLVEMRLRMPDYLFAAPRGV